MKRFSDLAECIAKELKVKGVVLDGEIISLDRTGKPAFYDLMKRQCDPVFYAFDILWLNGRDLRELSLTDRKKILRKVIPRKSCWIERSDAELRSHRATPSYRRLGQQLRREAIVVNDKKIRPCTKEISAPIRWHNFKISTTYSNHGHKGYANLLAGKASDEN